VRNPIGTDHASVKNRSSLAIAASLLGTDPQELERCLVVRQIKAANETYNVQLSPEKAELSRDTLAMLLYSRLFDWCVARLAVCCPSFRPSAERCDRGVRGRVCGSAGCCAA
jgi:myosin heavy subunit